MADVSSRSDSNLRFEKNIPYPHTVSDLKKGMLQEDSKPTLRARRENRARYRTQPITFNEIKEVDEENFATLQKGDLEKEPSSSNAGSHPRRSVPEPLNLAAEAPPEGSVQEQIIYPIYSPLSKTFERYFGNMQILASRRKSPRKDTFVKSASNEELDVNDETANHPSDNNEKVQTGKSEGVDQPKEEKK
ncbi:hypothetical protein TNCV_3365931 [Trichonephila clavipes]|nr:hypothetical protein TNCV_3365931 [Trichonephila clavipes]